MLGTLGLIYRLLAMLGSSIRAHRQQQNDGKQQQKYSLGEERLWQLLSHPWVLGWPKTQL